MTIAADTGRGTLQDVLSGPPAPAAAPPLPAAIVDDEIARIVRRAVGVRPLLAPLLLVIVGVVFWVDDAPWRRAAVAAVATAVVVGSAAIAWRVGRRGAAASVPANILGMTVAQLAMVIVTGGVDSPLLPIVIPFGFLTTLVLGRRPATLAVLGTQVVTLGALTLLQAARWAPVFDLAALGPVSAGRRLAVGAVVVIILLAGTWLVLAARARFESMVAEAVSARQAQLETWISWSHDLEAIGGEIAHELKNPLASIQGLSALVARDLPSGRARERMAVLQAEVTRMGGILDEFLTFSRPLTPLTREWLDPRNLGARVVALHEGAARAQGSRVVLRGTARRLHADPRKLLQVLVNLVQNALAAAADSTVEVLVADRDDRVELAVCDRGPGLDPAVRDQVFGAGVTTKPDGSGLGLTIAQAIVHQHDGTLTLSARPGGGIIAAVVLP